MKNVKFDQHRYEIPNQWNELSGDLLIVLSGLFAKGSTVAEIKTKMFLSAIHAHVGSRDGKFILHTPKTKHIVTPGEIQHAASVFDFLFINKTEKNTQGEDEITSELNSLLSKNPFPILPCSCNFSLVGPADGLTNQKYGEFIYMLTYLGQMKKDFYGGLNKLVATLYRRKNQEFDVEKIDANMLDVVKASPNVRVCVWFFVLGCLNFLGKKFPKTFSGSSSGTVNMSVFDSQQKLLYQLSNNDVTKADEIQTKDLYQVLYHVENSITATEELKAEVKKIKEQGK